MRLACGMVLLIGACLLVSTPSAILALGLAWVSGGLYHEMTNGEGVAFECSDSLRKTVRGS